MVSDHGKLFIGGISWDTDEERLKDYFSKYGEVVEAVIMRDRATGRARGFGFVVFTDPAVSERVIMAKHVINGRTVEAKKAVPRDDQQILNRNTSSIHGSSGPGRTKKIFVGGLASTVAESDFRRYFEQFGSITDVVVMYNHNTQRPRGFGFITYDSEDVVDRVLYKTFHELNGKTVEVKRAVPKELSPGPNQGAFIGYNYGLGRANNFLNAYAQGCNMTTVDGLGMRIDGRLNPLASGRSWFSPLSNTGYGMGMNLERGLTSSYGAVSNFGNSPGYGQMSSPFSNGNSTRYNTPISYNMGNTRYYSALSPRNNSFFSPNTQNVWGNGGVDTATNPISPNRILDSGGGSSGFLFGTSSTQWSPSSISAQGGANISSYNSGSMGYGASRSSFDFTGGGHIRNSGSRTAPTSSFAGSGHHERSFGDLYHNGPVYGNTTWWPTTPEQDS